MDGLPVATGDLPSVRSALGLCTYVPQVASVREARRFVEGVLAASCTPGVPALADDAGLLVSELAANAVLHARSEFDVAVYEVVDGVRVSVRDRSSALPVLTAPSATAMSGRGLALVQTLASRWGAGTSPVAAQGGPGKSVWFELAALAEDPGGALDGTAPDGDEEVSVEDLLAAWSEDVEADDLLPGPSVRGGAAGLDEVARSGASRVLLPALDAPSLLAAKEAMDDVLRELQLVLLASGPSSPADEAELGVARRLDRAARDFDDVRRQVRLQVSRAVAAGQPLVALELDLLPGTAARAVAYRAAVHGAEALAAGDLLLSTAESLRRHHAVREAYLGEVVAAAEA